MHRRSYIALAGSVIFAGCTSIESGSEPAEDRSDDSETPETKSPDTHQEETKTEKTDRPEDTDTPTEERSVGEAVIKSDELLIEEGDYSTDAYVRAEIQNVGDGATGTIEATARFYDTDGNLLESSDVYLSTLDSGETWRLYPPYFGDGEEVDSHEFEAKYTDKWRPPSNEGVILDEHKLHTSENEVQVVGTATNNRSSAIDYLEANAKFYYEQDVVAGTGYTNVTGVPEGDSWRFEVSLSVYSVAPKEDVSDYTVWLTNQA